MKNISLAKILGVIVTVGGLLVIIGWIYDIPVLKSISPKWISMKTTTAASFVFSGIALFFIADSIKKGPAIADVVLPPTALMILLLMSTLLISALTGIPTGVEDFLVKEPPGTVWTFIPGRPSIPTMINFVLMALAAIFTMLKTSRLKVRLGILGCVIMAIGGVPILGYVLNSPALRYAVEGWNVPMAFNTAVLFVLLGAGLLFAGASGELKQE